MATDLLRPSAIGRERPLGTKRGTYFVQTWGCQMNEEDSEQIGLYLQEIGFEQARDVWEAHVILLNTCSVRKKPEDKAFSLLGALVPTKEQRPDTVIGVCGCMAQIRADEIRWRAPHVDFVVGTAHISQIPALVEETLERRRLNQRYERPTSSAQPSAEPPVAGSPGVARHFVQRLDLPERKGAVVADIPQRKIDRHTKLKAFVPIQYGCDKFCTFCIVPSTRGRERSRPTSDILEEVAKLAALGTKEVTLLGQTVNSYGKNLPEGRVPFAQLLSLLSETRGLERIRYTSPYPRDFREDLIDIIRDCPKVMEHVHMPLQSGDDEMLRAMRRLYTRDSFLAIIESLRAAVPDIGITTDVIVGFPGESEAQFEATMETMRRVRFDGAFMFSYSTRPGTPAAEMEQVPAAVKKERLQRLIDLQNAITLERNEACVDKTFEVLVEGPSRKNPAQLQGYTREFRMAHFEGPEELRGQTVQVVATRARLWGLCAKLV